MDYDLIPAVDDLNNDSTQPSLSLSNMNHLIPENVNQQLQQQQSSSSQQPSIWNNPADFNTLEEMLGVGAPNVIANTTTNNNYGTNQLNSGHPILSNQSSLLPPQMTALPPQYEQRNMLTSYHQLPNETSSMINNNNANSRLNCSTHATGATTSATNNNNNNTNRLKRKYPSKDENVEQPSPQQKTSIKTLSTSLTTSSHTSIDDSTTEGNTNDKIPAIVSLTEPVIIDQSMLVQLGGLPYAELCKERAREAFKEAKKNEHLANGNFDRMKRRKKGDTSMTPREKYVRRLRMNQDSAAAARHAQEVYVSVLERLVRTSEEEKKSFLEEVQQVRTYNDQLKNKVDHLNIKVKTFEKQQVDSQQKEKEKDTSMLRKSNNYYDVQDKKNDPEFSKFLDLFKDTTAMGAQPDIGFQPARAV